MPAIYHRGCIRIWRSRRGRRTVLLAVAFIAVGFIAGNNFIWLFLHADSAEFALETVPGFRNHFEGLHHVIHVSKECSPVISFGGVGQMLGELAAAQAQTLESTRITVILPKYGFIDDLEVNLAGKYRTSFGSQHLNGEIFIREVHSVNFLFVSNPTGMDKLWRSRRS